MNIVEEAIEKDLCIIAYGLLKRCPAEKLNLAIILLEEIRRKLNYGHETGALYKRASSLK